MNPPLPRTFANLALLSAIGVAVFTVLSSLLVATVFGWSLSGFSTQPGLVPAIDLLIFAIGIAAWGGLSFVFALILTLTCGALVTAFIGAPLAALAELMLRAVGDWRAHALGSGVAGSIAASIVVGFSSLGGTTMDVLYVTVDFWPVLTLGLVAIAGFSAATGWFVAWRRHTLRLALSGRPAVPILHTSQ